MNNTDIKEKPGAAAAATTPLMWKLRIQHSVPKYLIFPNRSFWSLTTITEVALNGIDIAVLNLPHNACVIGETILRARFSIRAVPVIEDNHAESSLLWSRRATVYAFLAGLRYLRSQRISGIRLCQYSVSIAFSAIVFKEHLSKKAATGLVFLVAGTMIMLV